MRMRGSKLVRAFQASKLRPKVRALVKSIWGGQRVWDWLGQSLAPYTIYPIQIPAMEFLPGQDLILLELPQRYMPTMPNGLGYVHNILKTTGLRFQTVDVNILCYHRYHSRRILNGLAKVVAPNGHVMPEDPWDNTNTEEWFKPEAVEYFRPEMNEVITGLIAARPKILGISLNGSNRVFAREVVKGVRAELPDVPIVVGGYDCVYPHVAPRLFPYADYMVIGEAEMTLPPLVKALVAGGRPKDLPGILSRYDSPGRAWVPGPALQDLDAIDFPRYDWIDLGLYRDHQGYRLTPITATRGCRWSRCTFCAECFPWRKRDPKKVADEFEWLVERGSHDFHFNESDINGDPDALLAICDEIIRRKLNVSLCGQLRVDRRGTREFFDRLRAAGCTALRFGVDGWTDHTLRLQRKGYNMRLVQENLRHCHDAGIRVAVNLVLGVPGETEDDVQDIIANFLRNKGSIDLVESLNTLILVAGSEYYRNPDRHEIRFRGDKAEIYQKHPHAIPPELWYSEDPYIDHEVRAKRLKAVYTGLTQGGIPVCGFAKGVVERILEDHGSYGLDMLESRQPKPSSP
ncbi:MAG: radical SAM protein [Planctomycetes bacterium]|nr:radical SAM protein [Planctomycetota bacterium]